ncbi:dCTP deaminase [Candidatus Magnetominusculus xianensis]|uniref:dCTP deaminase n=1 Tax=Candidatus Magnetominusculus xianensis TaxID=1748249 RepID=A0ABR5SC44_9BACT|nr:dCTP deaminase [Candidatus Magnetominusculus xianensis]KWT79145.1 deoxycytidine triphosphate deaminase [Candidatus Magnetominusculus xianensis]MBF0405578.1 dCTP deaminase [Nitrospirota bacterium]
MVLSDRDIRLYLKSGAIKVVPPPDLDKQLGACTLDMRLGNVFKLFEHSKYPILDLKSEVSIDDIMKSIEVTDNECFILQPGEFALAMTKESLELPDNLVGRIDGRSSLGRLGLIIHGTASTFEPGWSGNPTLELSNIGRMPIALYPGMRICSFTFEMLSSTAEVPYRIKVRAKYMNQAEPLPSKITDDDLI